MTRSPDGGEGWRGPDESGRRAHGHRVRVRGRGEVGPKEEAVALRQARAGRARRPRDLFWFNKNCAEIALIFEQRTHRFLRSIRIA